MHLLRPGGLGCSPAAKAVFTFYLMIYIGSAVVAKLFSFSSSRAEILPGPSTYINSPRKSFSLSFDTILGRRHIFEQGLVVCLGWLIGGQVLAF